MEKCADQLVALLVMDLDYKGPPIHGHAPIRHQLAWRWALEVLGKEVMGEAVSSCLRQKEKEESTKKDRLQVGHIQTGTLYTFGESTIEVSKTDGKPDFERVNKTK